MQTLACLGAGDDIRVRYADGTVAAVRAIARETRERKTYFGGGGDWENEGAPERSRRVAIQAAVGSASRRRALTARDKLPRLGAPSTPTWARCSTVQWKWWWEGS